MRHFFGKMKTEMLYRIFRDSEGISVDSRTVTGGQIFFALWGENHNGNKFAADALAKGASWAVIDDPAYETRKTILVNDGLLELQALAGYYRKKISPEVIAITGTNGKTTTKELISTVLAKKFRVHSTRGNYNNQIGVPLSILSAPENTEKMILEFGASHVGEIRTLCIIARPDYGIVTNVGKAHTEGFGGYEGVLKTKTELYEYLQEVNGVALYNEKDPVLTGKIFRLVNRAVPFSDPAGTNLNISVISSGLNLCLTVRYMHETYKISTKLFGAYNIENIRAAIATGLFFGVDIKDAIDAVEHYQPANNRSQVKVTGNNTLICDSYNANPSSMMKAIESFAGLEADKKICILGDMLELGKSSNEEHKKVLKALRAKDLGNTILVGNNFRQADENQDFITFSSVAELKEYFSAEPLTGYYILIKGSRGIALEKIYGNL